MRFDGPPSLACIRRNCEGAHYISDPETQDSTDYCEIGNVTQQSFDDRMDIMF